MTALNMKEHSAPGLLITFCGLDGCGKTTTIRLLRRELERRGLPVVLTKQPTDDVRQSAIFRTFMDCPDHEAYDYRALSLMAASDRIQHSNKVILPMLRQGKIVISDRYFYSCLANLRARGYERDQWIYEVASHIPRPDAAFFLDVPVETAIRRVRSRPEEKDRYIDVPLQVKLRNEYQNLCGACGGDLLRSDGSVEETFEQVLQRIDSLLREKNSAQAAM